MTEMQARIQAVQGTLAHFAGREFAWGRVDCVKVALFHMRQIAPLPNFGLAKAGSYSTALGARRALKRTGHASLADALDKAGLSRIPPAFALPGDLIINAGEDGWEALAIYAGNGAILTFHQDAPDLSVVRAADITTSIVWRASWAKH